jgi:branched-chain amino acid transport system substrate-binding protein
MRGLGIKRAVAASIGLLIGATPVYAVTEGPVTDDIGVVKIRSGAPMFLGGYWTLSGPDTPLGLDQKRGVELALDDLGWTIAGHPVKLVAEDGQCNAEGGQAAATKLASNRNIVAVIGPDCSSEAKPGAPILWKAGLTSIGTSTTAPVLTDPNRGPEYDGFMRLVYNDLAQGAGDGKYFREVLKCDTLATAHDGSPYASQLVAVAEKEFEALGGKVVAREACAPTDVDMRPMLTSIATSKPCVLYFPVFTNASAQIARQAPEIPGLENAILIGGNAALSSGFLEAAGDAAVGLKLTNPDFSDEALGASYPELLAKYKKKYGENPAQKFHANSYDATMLIKNAVEKIAVKDEAGDTYIGRKALRDELFATKDYQGLSGPLTCNEHGDCADFKFAVYEYTNGDPNTYEIGTNPKKVYP